MIDFAEFGDEEELYLINTGPDSPWQSDPSIPPANSSTTGQVLKFELEGFFLFYFFLLLFLHCIYELFCFCGFSDVFFYLSVFFFVGNSFLNNFHSL